MPSSYIPAKDKSLYVWAENFSNLITANPTDYGLASGDATTIAASVLAFTDAMDVVDNPVTKSKTTVEDKNLARSAMVLVLRQYAMQIVHNPAVSAALRDSLGLNPHTSYPTRVRAPQTAPELTVQPAGNLGISVRYHVVGSGVRSKAKAEGARACQLFCRVSATPVVNTDGMFLAATLTKIPAYIPFSQQFGGQQAYFAARWINERGEAGPYSAIASMTIPYGQ